MHLCETVRRMVVGLCAGGMIGAAAAAETAPGSNRVVRLGEIVVVGSRAQRDLLETPTVESVSLDIATSVVDDEMIRRHNATTLTEAIDLSTGVFTEERGRKEKQLSSFRGQIYPYPDFSLNGVWQRSFWEVPAFFPAAAIGRVEVLRSGGAIMVGPNAGLVGAINVVPRRFDETTTLLDLLAGSRGAVRGSLVHGDRFDSGDYTIGLSHSTVEGSKRENDAERFTSFFGTGGWDPSERVHLELTLFGLTGRRELRRIQDPGLLSLQGRTEQYDPYHSLGGILRTRIKHSDSASTAIDLGYVHRSGDYSRKEADKPDVTNRERDWEWNAGVTHAQELTEANTLRLGVQYNQWMCPDGKRHFVGKRMDVHTLSGVLVDEHRWERLTADAGLRVTRRWYADYTESSFNIVGDSLSSRAIRDEWGDPAFTATLGAKYDLAERVALYGHAAVGTLEAPPGAVAMDEESLTRETRLLLDGGVRFEDAALGMLSAGLFITSRRNAVLLDSTRLTQAGDTFNLYVNRDVRQYGVEIEGRTPRLGDIVTLFGNATAMTSEVRTDSDWTTDREIPRVIAKAGVQVTSGRCDLNLFGRYVAHYKNRRFAQDGQYHSLGGFTDINLTCGVSLGAARATRLYLALENLLDDRFQTVVGYPDYGLQAFVGLQHRL